jgi:hypothetical protein
LCTELPGFDQLLRLGQGFEHELPRTIDHSPNAPIKPASVEAGKEEVRIETSSLR